MMFACVIRITCTFPDGFTGTVLDTPTFYLHSNVQGAMDEGGAEKVIRTGYEHLAKTLTNLGCTNVEIHPNATRIEGNIPL